MKATRRKFITGKTLQFFKNKSATVLFLIYLTCLCFKSLLSNYSISEQDLTIIELLALTSLGQAGFSISSQLKTRKSQKEQK